MFPRLFPEVPEDLAALDDEQLQSVLDEFRTVSRSLRAGEIDLSEVFGDAYTDEATASAEAMRQWQEAAASVQSFRDAQAARVAERDQFEAQAAELDAVFAEANAEGDSAEASAEGEDAEASASADDSDDDSDDDEDEDEDAAPADEAAAEDTSEVDAEVEPVDAETIVAAAVRFPPVGRRNRVAETAGDNPVVLVAAAGNSTARVRPGEELDGERYAEAFYDVNKSRGPVVPVKGGGRERILIASAHARFPDERTLDSRDPDGNMEKLRAAGISYAGRDETEIQSLLAAGVCPPPTPIYTLPELETAVRPVKDWLTTFNADRGGVTLPGVDTIGDVSEDAISVITNDDAIEGGTFATKTCANIDCTEWTPTFVDTIAHCRGVDNLMGRTWPEGVAKQNALTVAALARTADGKLLDGIDALSFHTAGGAVYGASSTLLYRLQLSRIQMISELRLPREQRLDVLLPFWGAEMFSLDLMGVAGGNPGRFDTPASAVDALLSQHGFNVSWHLDEGIDAAADQEIFSPQEATQVDFPGTLMIARVALPSTFIRLDTGTLELGTVRDSGLNAENKYQLFGELWENVARVGPLKAAHRIAITICPNGTLAPAGTLHTCAAS